MSDELAVVDDKKALRAEQRSAERNLKDGVFILRVMKYTTEHNCSIARACKALGVSYSTFKSKTRKPGGKEFLETWLEHTTKQAAYDVKAALQDVVQRQIAIATEQRFLAKDATAAASFLVDFMERMGTQLETTPDGGATLADFKRSFRPVTVPVQVNVSIDGDKTSATVKDATKKAED